MKTRFISMTLVILFTVATIAEATNSRIKNSSTASRHENATEQELTFENGWEINTLIPAESIETIQLEEWITSRENWEQKGEEMVTDNALKESSVMEEWIAGRENWEQEGEEMVTDNALKESSMMEEWIAGRENWEQEGEEMVSNNALEESSMMEEWITGRENWEQK